MTEIVELENKDIKHLSKYVPSTHQRVEENINILIREMEDYKKTQIQFLEKSWL